MRKELSVTLHIGGKQIEELSEEYLDRMAQRLSETMSRFYAQHPEEFAMIKD